jgi:hypothetical protein
MAVAMFMTLTGASPEQYDRLIASLDLDASPAIGQVLHLAAEAPDGLDVCEIWQTREAAEAFVDEHLWPKLAQLGIGAEIQFRVLPLHNLFAPALDTIERIGAVSLPAASAGSILRY